jgi:hypothetical protein
MASNYPALGSLARELETGNVQQRSELDFRDTVELVEAKARPFTQVA